MDDELTCPVCRAPMRLLGPGKAQCPRCWNIVFQDHYARDADTAAAKALFQARADAPSPVPGPDEEGPGILFDCPFCREEYVVDEALAGKRILCRNCGAESPVDGPRRARRPKRRQGKGPSSPSLRKWVLIAVAVAAVQLILIIFLVVLLVSRSR